MSERQIKGFLMYQQVCRQNANKNGTIFDNFDVKDAQLKEINFCIKKQKMRFKLEKDFYLHKIIGSVLLI